MTVKKIYISDDGIEFQNEWECADYEAKIRANRFKDAALLFDKDGKPLCLTEKGFEEAWFIRCKTKEAAEYLFNEFGDTYDNPWWGSHAYDLKAGCWYYEGDYWLATDELLRLADIVKSIIEG